MDTPESESFEVMGQRQWRAPRGGFQRQRKERRRKLRALKRRRQVERQREAVDPGAIDRVMARHRGTTAERMCFRKVPYRSKEEARAAAESSLRLAGTQRYGYPCPICRNWHLTRSAQEW